MSELNRSLEGWIIESLVTEWRRAGYKGKIPLFIYLWLCQVFIAMGLLLPVSMAAQAAAWDLIAGFCREQCCRANLRAWVIAAAPGREHTNS